MNVGQTPWLDEQTAAKFTELLRRRLSTGVYTSEDSIRYTFFAALLQAGFQPEQVILEYPHPAIPGAKIDTVVLTGTGQPAAALEFKYDRATPGRGPQPRPLKAGAALKDLIRLLNGSVFSELYFVYVTDKELAKYWGSPSNGLDLIFNLPCGQSMTVDADHFAGRPPTLHSAMGVWPGPTVLSSVLCETLPSDHYLRIYRVAAGTAVPLAPREL